jgi:hypothetical protein
MLFCVEITLRPHGDSQEYRYIRVLVIALILHFTALLRY